MLITRNKPTILGSLAEITVGLLSTGLVLFALAAPVGNSWATPQEEAAGAAGILIAQARERDTQPPAEVLKLEDELVRKGEEAFAAEDLALAEQVFRSLVQHNPGDVRGYLGLGKVYYTSKQYSAAAGAYSDALKLDRNSVPALLGLGRINVALFKWDQAFEFFQEVAEIDGSNAEAKRYIDNLLHGRLGEAESLPAEYYQILLSPAITRQELAALLYVRSFGLRSITSKPEVKIMTDISDRWARPYIIEVTKYNIMSIFPNHTFQPNASVTRGELAQALFNLVARVGLKEAYRAAAKGEMGLTDVDPSNRYYKAIQAMCALGIISPVEGGVFRPSDLVPGTQAVEAFNNLEMVANLTLPTELPTPGTSN